MRKKERTTLYVLASKLIDNYPLSDGGNHYGFITFDRKVKIHHNFGTQLYYNKQAAFKLLMKKKVLLVPGRNQWGTRADIALHKAATELFTSDGGDRPDAKNVLLVLTDGKQFMLKQDQTILPFQNFSESTKTLEVSLLSHKPKPLRTHNYVRRPFQLGYYLGIFLTKLALPHRNSIDKQTVYIRFLVSCITAMVFGAVGHCCSSYTVQKIGFTQIYSGQIRCKKSKLEGNQRQRW